MSPAAEDSATAIVWRRAVSNAATPDESDARSMRADSESAMSLSPWWAGREPHDPADFRGARQGIVGLLDASEPVAQLWRHLGASAGDLAHVQGQQLVGRGEVALGRVVHLV